MDALREATGVDRGNCAIRPKEINLPLGLDKREKILYIISSIQRRRRMDSVQLH